MSAPASSRSRYRAVLEFEVEDDPDSSPAKWDWATLLDEPEVRLCKLERVQWVDIPVP